MRTKLLRMWGRKKLAGGSSGFALIEMLVVIGIIGMAVGLIGSSVFQVFSVQQLWRAGVVATKDLRHAGSWFAGDALHAETVDIVVSDPPCDQDVPLSGYTVTLTWTGGDGLNHTSVYSVSADNELIRTYDGGDNVMAPRVVSHCFAHSGNVLRLELEVEADRGGTDSISLDTYLRNLQ